MSNLSPRGSNPFSSNDYFWLEFSNNNQDPEESLEDLIKEFAEEKYDQLEDDEIDSEILDLYTQSCLLTQKPDSFQDCVGLRSQTDPFTLYSFDLSNLSRWGKGDALKAPFKNSSFDSYKIKELTTEFSPFILAIFTVATNIPKKKQAVAYLEQLNLTFDQICELGMFGYYYDLQELLIIAKKKIHDPTFLQSIDDDAFKAFSEASVDENINFTYRMFVLEALLFYHLQKNERSQASKILEIFLQNFEPNQFIDWILSPPPQKSYLFFFIENLILLEKKELIAQKESTSIVQTLESNEESKGKEKEVEEISLVSPQKRYKGKEKIKGEDHHTFNMAEQILPTEKQNLRIECAFSLFSIYTFTASDFIYNGEPVALIDNNQTTKPYSCMFGEFFMLSFTLAENVGTLNQINTLFSSIEELHDPLSQEETYSPKYLENTIITYSRKRILSFPLNKSLAFSNKQSCISSLIFLSAYRSLVEKKNVTGVAFLTKKWLKQIKRFETVETNKSGKINKILETAMNLTELARDTDAYSLLTNIDQQIKDMWTNRIDDIKAIHDQDSPPLGTLSKLLKTSGMQVDLENLDFAEQIIHHLDEDVSPYNPLHLALSISLSNVCLENKKNETAIEVTERYILSKLHSDLCITTRKY